MISEIREAAYRRGFHDGYEQGYNRREMTALEDDIINEAIHDADLCILHDALLTIIRLAQQSASHEDIINAALEDLPDNKWPTSLRPVPVKEVRTYWVQERPLERRP